MSLLMAYQVVPSGPPGRSDWWGAVEKQLLKAVRGTGRRTDRKKSGAADRYTKVRPTGRKAKTSGEKKQQKEGYKSNRTYGEEYEEKKQQKGQKAKTYRGKRKQRDAYKSSHFWH